jgi:prepilin-type N-terminal cleavage/methylation domain-containing protein
MYALKNKKGFTLIEIVIVLAIAALILAGVLIAVTGAQTSRRDTQRKNDISTVASYLEQVASNNSGAYPATAALFNTAITPYTGNLFDPLSGTVYTYGAATASAPTNSAAAGVTYTLTGRKYQICIGLEQGTSTCRNN